MYIHILYACASFGLSLKWYLRYCLATHRYHIVNRKHTSKESIKFCFSQQVYMENWIKKCLLLFTLQSLKYQHKRAHNFVNQYLYFYKFHEFWGTQISVGGIFMKILFRRITSLHWPVLFKLGVINFTVGMIFHMASYSSIHIREIASLVYLYMRTGQAINKSIKKNDHSLSNT